MLYEVITDCCGVSDGAAAAIVTTPEIARGLGKKDLVTIKAIQLSVSSGKESTMTDWDGSYVPNTRNAAALAYKDTRRYGWPQDEDTGRTDNY